MFCTNSHPAEVRATLVHRESRGIVPSLHDLAFHALYLGELKEANRLAAMLESAGPAPFRIFQVSRLDYAAEEISQGEVDIVLLDLGTKRGQASSLVEAARVAAPDIPLVVLSECEDESLAMDSLRQGAQECLPKEGLDCAILNRALRHSIERHRLQKDLHKLSLLDDLTGLRNRRGFFTLAEQHLRVLQRKGAALLVYLDLDDLKKINDTHGHVEGNRALVVAANILRASFRQSDIIARIGGDEFCVLMTDAAQDSEGQVRKRLQQRVDMTNSLSTWPFHVSFSIGIVDVPTTCQPPIDELLHLADAQMYEEKKGKQLRGTLPAAFRHLPVA
jgi:two-component system, cell cycle response regulator